MMSPLDLAQPAPRQLPVKARCTCETHLRGLAHGTGQAESGITAADDYLDLVSGGTCDALS